ncbi:hypothetical protein J6590_010875 [Homalodisca vitripennis]|nr:hypothetical protein J6590_010875 [Homalodisca vitripennis]
MADAIKRGWLRGWLRGWQEGGSGGVDDPVGQEGSEPLAETGAPHSHTYSLVDHIHPVQFIPLKVNTICTKLLRPFMLAIYRHSSANVDVTAQGAKPIHQRLTNIASQGSAGAASSFYSKGEEEEEDCISCNLGLCRMREDHFLPELSLSVLDVRKEPYTVSYKCGGRCEARPLLCARFGVTVRGGGPSRPLARLGHCLRALFEVTYQCIGPLRRSDWSLGWADPFNGEMCYSSCKKTDKAAEWLIALYALSGPRGRRP